jgi:hypothetical protein
MENKRSREHTKQLACKWCQVAEASVFQCDFWRETNRWDIQWGKECLLAICIPQKPKFKVHKLDLVHVVQQKPGCLNMQLKFNNANLNKPINEYCTHAWSDILLYCFHEVRTRPSWQLKNEMFDKQLIIKCKIKEKLLT